MAQKRMISKKVIQTDVFMDMPLSAQALYFHLNLEADDDGFITNVKTVKRMVGASEDDLNLLVVKHFLIVFEAGILVIKHWKIHNTIKRDRYNETICLNEKRHLIVSESKEYMYSEKKCIQNGSILDTQVRLELEEVSKVKKRIDKISIELGNEFQDFLENISISKQKCEIIYEMIQQSRRSVEIKTRTKLMVDAKEIRQCSEKYISYCVDFSNEEFAKYLNISYSNYWSQKATKLANRNKSLMSNSGTMFSKTVIPDEKYFEGTTR